MNEARQNNLVTFADRPEEERRELGRRGGIASGESRNNRKRLRDELSALLASGDVQQRVCTALIDKALQGDPRAFQLIRSTVGEDDAVQIEADIRATAAGVTIDAMTDDEKAEAWLLYEYETEHNIKGLFSRLFTLENRRKMIEELL